MHSGLFPLLLLVWPCSDKGPVQARLLTPLVIACVAFIVLALGLQPRLPPGARGTSGVRTVRGVLLQLASCTATSRSTLLLVDSIAAVRGLASAASRRLALFSVQLGIVSGSGSMSFSYGLVLYPSVHMYPPFGDVELLAIWTAELPGWSGTVAGKLDSHVDPLVGGCGARPSERVVFYPSVQLYPPLDASLWSAGRGCGARKRRDVEQLPVRWARTPTSSVSGPGSMVVPSMSPLYTCDSAPAVLSCCCLIRRRLGIKQLPTCSPRPPALPEVLVPSRWAIVARINSTRQWRSPASDASPFLSFGGRSMWPSTWNDVYPSVQMCRPIDAALAGRGCVVRIRRDVVSLSMRWARAMGGLVSRAGEVHVRAFFVHESSLDVVIEQALVSVEPSVTWHRGAFPRARSIQIYSTAAASVVCPSMGLSVPFRHSEVLLPAARGEPRAARGRCVLRDSSFVNTRGIYRLGAQGGGSSYPACRNATAWGRGALAVDSSPTGSDWNSVTYLACRDSVQNVLANMWASLLCCGGLVCKEAARLFPCPVKCSHRAVRYRRILAARLVASARRPLAKHVNVPCSTAFRVVAATLRGSHLRGPAAFGHFFQGGDMVPTVALPFGLAEEILLVTLLEVRGAFDEERTVARYANTCRGHFDDPRLHLPITFKGLDCAPLKHRLLCDPCGAHRCRRRFLQSSSWSLYCQPPAL